MRSPYPRCRPYTTMCQQRSECRKAGCILTVPLGRHRTARQTASSVQVYNSTALRLLLLNTHHLAAVGAQQEYSKPHHHLHMPMLSLPPAPDVTRRQQRLCTRLDTCLGSYNSLTARRSEYFLWSLSTVDCTTAVLQRILPLPGHTTRQRPFDPVHVE